MCMLYIMSNEEGASNLQERLQKLEKECAALKAKAGKKYFIPIHLY